eukprot:10126-Heterococcus_DN1.PRE.2
MNNVAHTTRMQTNNSHQHAKAKALTMLGVLAAYIASTHQQCLVDAVSANVSAVLLVCLQAGLYQALMLSSVTVMHSDSSNSKYSSIEQVCIVSTC